MPGQGRRGRHWATLRQGCAVDGHCCGAAMPTSWAERCSGRSWCQATPRAAPAGPAAAPPPLLRNALVPRAGSAHPASSCAEPKAAASAALAAARQQPELAFSDATLGTEAAALRRRQQQALGAMAAALQQQQQGPGSSAIVAAAGPAHLAVQAVPHRLLRLQLENVQCVRQLHGLHMLQMQRHLEEAARLKRRAAGQGGRGAADVSVAIVTKRKRASTSRRRVLTKGSRARWRPRRLSGTPPCPP